MNKLRFNLFLLSLFSFSVASAKYTCSSLFIEEISIEQQYKNVFENQKITLVRDVPNYEKDSISMHEIEFRTGDEFVARLMDINRLFESPIPNGSLSTYEVDGIRSMAFKIIEMGPEQIKIEFSLANSATKIYLVDTQKFKTIYAHPIKSWEKILFDFTNVKFDTSQENFYKLYRIGASGSKEVIASLNFDEHALQVDVLLSDTSLLFRKNNLNTILLKKFLLEYPQIRKILGELAATNETIFIKSLLKEMRKTLSLDFSSENFSVKEGWIQARELASRITKEEFLSAQINAFQQTPFYKTNRRLGFSRVGQINIDWGHKTIEVQSLRDE